METMVRGQKLVLVSQVILAELPGRIALSYQQLSNGWLLFIETQIGAGHSYFTQACAEHTLSRDKCGAACGTALLSVVISKVNAFIGNAVNVGSFVTHQTFRVSAGAGIGLTDVVAPNDNDVGFLILRLCGERKRSAQKAQVSPGVVASFL